MHQWQLEPHLLDFHNSFISPAKSRHFFPLAWCQHSSHSGKQCRQSDNRGLSLERNCVLCRWESETLNRGYYMAVRRYEISLRVKKYFWTREENFVSPCNHGTFCLLYKYQLYKYHSEIVSTLTKAPLRKAQIIVQPQQWWSFHVWR